MANRYLNVETRFWMKVQKMDDCWEWTGSTGRKGYGRFRFQGRQVAAHRVACILAGRELSEDMTIDHLCLNKKCVNPAHLEQVTRGENARRYTRAITHCPQGHPYDERNTITSKDGKRTCRKCNYAHQRQYYWERKAGLR